MSAAAVGCRPRAAHAQAERSIALEVRAPSSVSVRCFEVEVLRQRIAYYARERLARASELRLELFVDSPDSAELRVYHATELVARRSFDQLPDACADRRDAVALSIAMALDGVVQELAPGAQSDAANATLADAAPTSDVAGTEDARAGAATSQAVIQPAQHVQPGAGSDEPAEDNRTAPEEAEDSGPTEISSDDEAERHSRALRFGLPLSLHLGIHWLAHALPSPVWTGVLGAELRLNSMTSIDASAMASTTGSSSFAGGHVRSSLIGGELLGCAALGFASFAAQGCAGIAAAASQAGGRDYPVRFADVTLPWVASTLRLALRWPSEHWVSLRLVIQGYVNMVRPELRVEGASRTLTPPWVGASIGLDLVVALE